MAELVLVELPGGSWGAVRIPKNADVSQFRDMIEEMGLDTRGVVTVETVASLRKMVKEAGNR